nr:glycosyltransferase family 2 protein [Flavobacterium sp.]
MNHRPLISVIMPVYNCVLYLEQSINSILKQTFEDFELIIIEDCSFDGTVEVLRKFVDPRIKIINNQSNEGVSKSTNKGFKLARGKYIARMDGDDIAVKDRFEKQLRILEDNPDIFVCGGLVRYLGGTNSIIKYKETNREIVTELLISCSVCMGTAMFRRKELKSYFYDEKKRSGEDYDFWCKIVGLGEFYNIQEVLLFYRVHENQASKKNKTQQIIDDVKIQLSLLKKLNYNSLKYSDELLTKILLVNNFISIKEFVLFINWIEVLQKINNKTFIYSSNQFKSVLSRIKRRVLFELYFKKTDIGITKKWRFQILLYLPLSDLKFVIRLKVRELRRRLFKK